MTVYVDSFYTPYRRMLMCHMAADTLRELHQMANRIGVQRRWFQGDHYDIAKSKRKLAVKAGAVELNLREMAAMMVERRRAARRIP